MPAETQPISCIPTPLSTPTPLPAPTSLPTPIPLRPSPQAAQKYSISSFILLCLVLPSGLSQSIAASVSVSTINTLSNYTFSINDVNFLLPSVSGVITLTFNPNLYNFSLGLHPCSEVLSNTPLSCQCSPANVISLPFPGPIPASSSLEIFIQNLLNPPNTATSSSAYSYTFTASNGTILSQILNRPIRGYTPASLLSCTASFTPNLLSTLATLNINLLTRNSLSTNAGLITTFPATWDYPSNTSPTPLLNFNPTTASFATPSPGLKQPTSIIATSTIVSFIGAVNQNLPGSTNLVFSFQGVQSPPTTSNTNSFTLTTMTPDGLSKIDESSCLVSVNPSSMPVALLYGSNSSTLPNLVLGASTPIQISMTLTQPLLDKDTLFLSTNSSMVQVFSTARIAGLSTADVATVTCSSAQCSLLTQIQSGVLNPNTALTITSSISVQATITTGSFTFLLAIGRQVPPNTLITNSSSGFQGMSPSGQPTNLPLTTVGSLSLNVVPSSFTSLALAVANSTAFTPTSFIWTMVLANGLGLGFGLLVSPAPEMTLPTQCASLISASLPNGQSLSFNSSSCTVNANSILVSSNSVNVAPVNSIVLPARSTLTVTISNLTNPPSTKPSSPITMTTLFNSTLSSPVDTGANTVTSTPKSIPSASFTSSSALVFAPTNYTFAFSVDILASNTQLLIALPSEIPISPNPSVADSNANPLPFSLVNSLGQNALNLASSSLNTPVLTSLPVLPALVAGRTYLSLTSLNSNANGTVSLRITLSGFLTPSSTSPSSPLQFALYDSSGFLMANYLKNDLIVANTQLRPISPQVASPSSTPNGAVLPLTIVWTSNVPLYANDTIACSFSTVSYDSQMAFTSASTCSLTSSSATLGCSSVLNGSQSFQVGLLPPATSQGNDSSSPLVTPSSLITLTITNVRFARTRLQPSSLTISVLTRAVGSTPVSPNSQLAPIKNIALTIEALPSQLNQLQPFTVSVTTSIALVAGDSLQMVLPPDYTQVVPVFTPTPPANSSIDPSLTAQSLCSSPSLFCYNAPAPSLVLIREMFLGFFNSTNTLLISFKNNVFRSPLTLPFSNQGFSLTTFTASNTQMEYTLSTSAVFYLTCAFPCQTCQCSLCALSSPACACSTGCSCNSTHCARCNPTSCLSCYQPNTGYTPNITYTANTLLGSSANCVSQCLANELSLNGVCVPCAASCAQCSVSPSQCTSCFTNSSLPFLSSSTCVGQCPPGSFSNHSLCQPCSAPCLTCLNLASACTSCSSPLFLLKTSSTCIPSTGCQALNMIASNSNQCLPCDQSCTLCSLQSTFCKSCAPNYSPASQTSIGTLTLYTCTTQCPTGTVNDTSVSPPICRCASLCRTCFNSTTNCTSCPPSLFLQSSLCVASCGSAFYANDSLCLPCQANCASCNATTCLACSPSFFLLGSACTSSCPVAYFVANTACQACPINCAVCSNANICTSCVTPYLLDTAVNDSSPATACVATCPSTKVNFNNSLCLSFCGIGYQNLNGVCQVLSPTVSASSPVLPFPFTIIIASFVILCIISKLTSPATVVSAALVAIFGLLEVVSWLTLTAVVLSLDLSTVAASPFMSSPPSASDPPSSSTAVAHPLKAASGLASLGLMTGIFILAAALACNLILNLAQALLVRRLWSNPEFQAQINRIRQRSCLGGCVFWCTAMASIFVSHKLVELLFSNIFSTKVLSLKVPSIRVLLPFNILRFASMVSSCLAIAAASFINHQAQVNSSLLGGSSLLLLTADTLIITIAGIITTCWVTMRHPDQYEPTRNSTMPTQESLGQSVDGDQEHAFGDEPLHRRANQDHPIDVQNSQNNINLLQSEDSHENIHPHPNAHPHSNAHPRSNIHPVQKRLNEHDDLASQFSDQQSKEEPGRGKPTERKDNKVRVIRSKAFGTRPPLGESHPASSEPQLASPGTGHLPARNHLKVVPLAKDERLIELIEGRLSEDERTQTKEVEKVDEIGCDEAIRQSSRTRADQRADKINYLIMR